MTTPRFPQPNTAEVLQRGENPCGVVTYRVTLTAVATGEHAAMAVAMNPRRIVGNWISGYALDIHTIFSTHMGINEFGHDVFDSKRSELGELLYRMKYRQDRSAASAIVEAAVSFLQRSRN